MEENSEMIWKIGKKGKSNSDKIGQKYGRKVTSERASSQKIIWLQDADNENKMAGRGR